LLRFWLTGMCALLCAVTAEAGRNFPQGVEPKQISDTIACATITDGPARLACFDKTVGVLQHAVAAKDIMVVDKEGIKSAKKSLFGLALPSFNLFGSSQDSEDSQITEAISSARFQGDGTLSFVLDSGASWVQTDDYSLPILPKRGAMATIKRASLGGFFVTIGRQSFRARRVN
jgi:hypothetical protein